MRANRYRNGALRQMQGSLRDEQWASTSIAAPRNRIFVLTKQRCRETRAKEDAKTDA